VSSQPADDARDRTVPPDAETRAPDQAPEGEASAAPPPAEREKRPLFRRRPKDEPAPPPPVDPSPVSDADTRAAEGETTVIPKPEKERPPSVGQLRRRRKEIQDERQEVVYHLGGLAFELYRRDMLTEAVMRRRAAEVWGLDESVRDIDRQLEEIEHTRRERREERRRKPPAEPVPLGHCVNCGSPWYQADARFCWSCGAAITRPENGAPSTDDDEGDDQPTTVIRERGEES
jgi:hypothetical protein